MARMHTRRRGSSGSDKPVTDDTPEWSTVEADRIEERILELAESGMEPSQIGLTLRDEGVEGVPIPNVKLATGKKVTEILEAQDAKPSLPSDLRNLLEKAVNLREHVDKNPQDHHNKHALQNVEAKVRRLVEYYRGDQIEEEFTYSYADAVDRLE